MHTLFYVRNFVVFIHSTDTNFTHTLQMLIIYLTAKKYNGIILKRRTDLMLSNRKGVEK